MLAALPIGVALAADPGANVVRANAAFAKLVDLDVPKHAGERLFEITIPLDRIYRNGRPARRDELSIVQSRTKGLAVVEAEFEIRARDETMRSIVAYSAPLFGDDGAVVGAIGAYTDVTDRKRYENTLKFLAEASNLLSLSLDRSSTLDSIARLCVPAFADWCSIDVIDDSGRLRSAALHHADPEKTTLGRMARAHTFDEGAMRVIESRQPELLSEIESDRIADSANDPKTIAILQTFGMKSVMIVPMVARGRAIGAITFVTSESGRRYATKDLTPARQLAYRAALAYDNARLYEREHNVAVALQQAFLPSDLPQVPGLSLDAYHQAGLRESEVGGDWYDAFLLPDGRLGLSIGDVAGRGLRAAVVMGEVRQAFRAAALEGHSPAVIMMRADRLLKLVPNATMVTAIFGIIDPRSSMFTYATAGHPPPVLACPDQQVTELPHEGLPLAVRGEDMPVEWQIPLPPGALLVLYTDGLIEHRRAVVEGESELLAAVDRVAAEAPPSPARAIQETVLRERPEDDVAVLTVGIAHSPIDQLDMRFPAIPPSAPLVRQALRTLATGLRIPEDKLFAVQVAVGEALNNAIEHAYGVSTGSVRLRAWTTGYNLVIDVTDAGHWRPKRDDGRDEGRGRGIAIMRGLMDGVEILAEEASTTVRLTIALSENDQLGGAG